jgi:quinol monooxygenase YgiN
MSNTSNSKSFIVIAEFQVKQDSIAAFLAAARNDAERSLASEPGCRQFDIVQPNVTDGTVIFYEVYDSREAFDAHLKTPHVAAFRAAFPPLIVAERPVRFADRHFP